jgi:integrase
LAQIWHSWHRNEPEDAIMPRHAKGPRLYLDPRRNQYVIRDGVEFIRTGYAEDQRPEAEKALHKYLGQKHKPQRSPVPSITDVLLLYWDEHLSHGLSHRSNKSCIRNLSVWWDTKLVSDITQSNCRAYVAHKGDSTVAARKDLQALRAAVHYWHKSDHGPLERVPMITTPPAPAPRERWLTRQELARLLWAARRTPHLARFILLGYYTGSRSGPVRALQWDWIDFAANTMRRKGVGEAERATKRRPMVRLGKRILTHLRRWKRLDGPAGKYVVHWDGKPLKRELRHSWHRAVKLAGLDRSVTPHVLRHTRATHLMQKGADIWQVAGHLGMTVQILERTYGHHHPSYQQKVADL